MSGVISIKTTNQYSLITVENYSLFQDASNENVQPKVQPATSQKSDSQKSDKCPTNDQPKVRPTTTTQEYKNSLKNKISSLHSDILSKSFDEQAPKKTFAELLKSKGIA